MDDGVIGGSRERVLEALTLLEVELRVIGLEINRSADKSTWISRSGTLRNDITFREENLIVMGSPVGTNDFFETTAHEGVMRNKALLKNLSGLGHKQGQTLILRKCLSYCRMIHLMRTTPPDQIRRGLRSFDGLVLSN